MRNPFETLGKPKVEKPKGEEVTGLFSCGEKGCYEKSHSARYIEEVEILTWKPSCGHVTYIEGFTLD